MIEPIKSNNQVLTEVEGQLQPLLIDFHPTSKQNRAFLDDYTRFAKLLVKAGMTDPNLALAIGILEYGTKLIQKNAAFEARETAKAERVLEALSYLSFVELLATPYIDIAISILISKGYALHVTPDRKHPYIRHASCIKDLDSSTWALYAKLDFLDMNGFPFFSKWIDRQLRNKIAHLDFHIDNEGVFFIEHKNGKRKKVDLKAKLNSFNEYHDAVGEYVSKELKKRIPTDSPRANGK